MREPSQEGADPGFFILSTTGTRTGGDSFGKEGCDKQVGVLGLWALRGAPSPGPPAASPTVVVGREEPPADCGSGHLQTRVTQTAPGRGWLREGFQKLVFPTPFVLKQHCWCDRCPLETGGVGKLQA